MKTILYMTQTLNGYIAKENGDSSWASSADLRRFKELTTKAGNMVMGSNTYEVLKTEENFPLADRMSIIMTRDVLSRATDQSEGVIFTDRSPSEVISLMIEKGFEEVMVIGGGKINKSFLEQELIDEIYVTIAPFMLGRGIHFIDPSEFIEQQELQVDLELLETLPLGENELQLHYRVKK
jgi:dihydrofolate reductase